MDDKLQDALKKAAAEVEQTGITDVELKKIAFSKAIDFYLGGGNERPDVGATSAQPASAQRVSTGTGDFWANLMNHLPVEQRRLKDLYALKGKQITLAIRAVPGEQKADRQRNLVALVLLAYQEGFGDEWVSSVLIAEAAKQSGLYDTSNFSGNLKSDWFRSMGVRKGLNYRLSAQGISHAKELLKSLTQ